MFPEWCQQAFGEHRCPMLLGAIDDRVDGPRIGRPGSPERMHNSLGERAVRVCEPPASKTTMSFEPRDGRNNVGVLARFLMGRLYFQQLHCFRQLAPKDNKVGQRCSPNGAQDFRGTPLPDASRRASMIEFTILALTDRVPHASRALSDNGFRTFGPQ